MPTLYSIVNETRNRNRILEMCKFRILVSITYYVHNSLPILTKFCMRLTNVVASMPIVCQTNRKYFADFRGVQIQISAVFRLCWHFSTDQHQIPWKGKIKQCRLCILWWMKPEIEINFRDVQIPDLVSIRYYVHNSLPILTKFCMRLRNVVASTPVVCQETGSSLPILEVCRFRFRQFSGSGDRIIQQISTKSHVKIKFSNANFVFNGKWNWK